MHRNRIPIMIIEAGLIPACQLESRVIVLACHEIGRDDGTTLRPPGIICCDAFSPTIAISQLKLSQEHRRLSKKLVATVADMSAEPTIGQFGGYCIVPVLDK